MRMGLSPREARALLQVPEPGSCDVSGDRPSLTHTQPPTDPGRSGVLNKLPHPPHSPLAASAQPLPPSRLPGPTWFHLHSTRPPQCGLQMGAGASSQSLLPWPVRTGPPQQPPSPGDRNVGCGGSKGWPGTNYVPDTFSDTLALVQYSFNPAEREFCGMPLGAP